MLFLMELFLIFLRLSIYILVAFVIIGVIPYACYLIREEIVEWSQNRDQKTTGHHRWGMANANDLAQKFLEQRRIRLFEEANFTQLAIERSDWAL